MAQCKQIDVSWGVGIGGSGHRCHPNWPSTSLLTLISFLTCEKGGCVLADGTGRDQSWLLPAACISLHPFAHDVSSGASPGRKSSCKCPILIQLLRTQLDGRLGAIDTVCGVDRLHRVRRVSRSGHLTFPYISTGRYPADFQKWHGWRVEAGKKAFGKLKISHWGCSDGALLLCEGGRLGSLNLLQRSCDQDLEQEDQVLP
jgi:hypothetical protein